MNLTRRKNLLFLFAFLTFSINLWIYCNEIPLFNVEKTKKDITAELSQNISSFPSKKPLFILIGGYPGSGKTTLLTNLAKKHDITIISWDSIRQSLLDKHLKGSPFDWEIIEAVYQNLLRICFQYQKNVAIDANAYSQNIIDIEEFIKKEQQQHQYKIVKICLNPPTDTLFERLRARKLIDGVHQGTEVDLQNDLISPRKKINLNDYALVIDTKEVIFETELNIVDCYLKSLNPDLHSTGD